MNRDELIAELKRLDSLLNEAYQRAAAQYALVDKLTAASIRIQALLKKLAVPQPSGSAAKALRKKVKGPRPTVA